MEQVKMMSYWITMGLKSHDWCLKNSEDFQLSDFQAILATSSNKKYNLHYDYSRLNNATPSKDIRILTSRTCECHSGPLGLGHVGLLLLLGTQKLTVCRILRTARGNGEGHLSFSGLRNPEGLVLRTL